MIPQDARMQLPPLRQLMNEVDGRYGKPYQTLMNDHMQAREWFHAHMLKSIGQRYHATKRPQTTNKQ